MSAGADAIVSLSRHGTRWHIADQANLAKTRDAARGTGIATVTAMLRTIFHFGVPACIAVVAFFYTHAVGSLIGSLPDDAPESVAPFVEAWQARLSDDRLARRAALAGESSARF